MLYAVLNIRLILFYLYLFRFKALRLLNNNIFLFNSNIHLICKFLRVKLLTNSRIETELDVYISITSKILAECN